MLFFGLICLLLRTYEGEYSLPLLHIGCEDSLGSPHCCQTEPFNFLKSPVWGLGSESCGFLPPDLHRAAVSGVHTSGTLPRWLLTGEPEKPLAAGFTRCPLGKISNCHSILTGVKFHKVSQSEAVCGESHPDVREATDLA